MWMISKSWAKSYYVDFKKMVFPNLPKQPACSSLLGQTEQQLLENCQEK